MEKTIKTRISQLECDIEVIKKSIKHKLVNKEIEGDYKWYCDHNSYIISCLTRIDELNFILDKIKKPSVTRNAMRNQINRVFNSRHEKPLHKEDDYLFYLVEYLEKRGITVK